MSFSRRIFQNTKTVLEMPLRAKILQSELAPITSIRTMNTSSEMEPEVKFYSNGGLRTILLNRPKKLNALNQNMCQLITPRLQEWLKSDLSTVLLLKGAGDRALCAGGDVAAISNAILERGDEGSQSSIEYFKDEYELDHFIAAYPKPYVSFLNGITMGGGVGLSLNGSFRVATEKTVVAMPETNIGFFPDVGGSFFLSRLDGQLGVFLGLTSHRLSGRDVVYAGLATHYIPSHRLEKVEQRLVEISSSGQKNHELYKMVNDALEEFSEEPEKGYVYELSGEKRSLIDDCFKFDTVEEIIQALEANGSEFALKTKDTMLARSPTSLKVTLAAIRRGKNLDVTSAFTKEYEMAENFVFAPSSDFAEGVNALLITKPSRKAQWNPSSIGEVTDEIVHRHLNKRQGSSAPAIEFHLDADFKDYPHHFGYPSEKEIEDYVIGNNTGREFKVTRKEVFEHFIEVYSKSGLGVKLAEVLDRKSRLDSDNKEFLDWVY